LVGKAFGKQPLERLKMRWEDNIKMELKQEGRKVMEVAEDGVKWVTFVFEMYIMVSVTSVLYSYYCCC
jgi:hypothetical protein